MLSAGHTSWTTGTFLGQLMSAPTAEAAAHAIARAPLADETYSILGTIGVHLTRIDSGLGTVYDEHLQELKNSEQQAVRKVPAAQQMLAHMVGGLNGEWSRVQLATARSEGALLGATARALLFCPHLPRLIRDNIKNSLHPFSFGLPAAIQRSFSGGFRNITAPLIERGALPEILDIAVEAESSEFDLWLFGAQAFIQALLGASDAEEHRHVVESSIALNSPFLDPQQPEGLEGVDELLLHESIDRL